MSNHVHVVLRNRPDVVAQWSDQEVALRWLKVYPGRRIQEQLAEPTDSDVAALVADQQKLAKVRRRLSDISWLMRSLSEPVARMANGQDECTGHFWEGRFKAQRIVDEAGLLACAMYVDLNPVRAALAQTPETSLHTSAYDRIKGAEGKQILSAAFDLVPVASHQAGEQIRTIPVEQLRRQQKAQRGHSTGRRVRRDGWLSPLTLQRRTLSQDAQVHRDGLRASDRGFLSLSVDDYLDLLRWTARNTVDAVKSKLPASLGKILAKLGIEASQWCELVWNWKRYFGGSSCAGHPESMRRQAEQTGHCWYRGQRSAAVCFVA